MGNHIDRSCVVLAESVRVGVPGARDRLRKILQTVGIGEEARELIVNTLGLDGFARVAYA